MWGWPSGVQDELEEAQTQSQRVADDSDEETAEQRPARGKKRKANPSVLPQPPVSTAPPEGHLRAVHKKRKVFFPLKTVP